MAWILLRRKYIDTDIKKIAASQELLDFTIFNVEDSQWNLIMINPPTLARERQACGYRVRQRQQLQRTNPKT